MAEDKKKEQLKIWISIGALVLVLAAVYTGVFLFIRSFQNVNVLEANWEISLPADCEEIYYQDDDEADAVSFQGDSLRYTVYSYEDEALVSSLFNWKEGPEDSPFQEGTPAVVAHDWLNRIGVPTARWPLKLVEADLGYPYPYWYQQGTNDVRDELLVFWDREEKRIYFLENFM